MTRLSFTPLMRLLVCGAFVLLAGCGGMGGKASQLYVLNPSTDMKSDAEASNKNLAVSMPSAPAYLDTTRIALSRTSTTTDYFASSDWTDRVPVLVQDLTVKAFEKSGKVKTVFRDSGMFKADYGLQVEIRDFEAQYEGSSGAPKVAVGFDLRLIKQPDRDIVATHTVNKTVQAGANNLDSIVGAFNEALGGALTETVDWTVRTMPTTPTKKVHRKRHRKAKAEAPAESQPAAPQQ